MELVCRCSNGRSAPKTVTFGDSRGTLSTINFNQPPEAKPVAQARLSGLLWLPGSVSLLFPGVPSVFYTPAPFPVGRTARRSHTMRMLVLAGICAITTSGFMLGVPRADTCRSSGPVMKLTEEQALAIDIHLDLPAWMGVPLREIPKEYAFRRFTSHEWVPSQLWYDNYIRVRARRGLRTFDPHNRGDVLEFQELLMRDAHVRYTGTRLVSKVFLYVH